MYIHKGKRFMVKRKECGKNVGEKYSPSFFGRTSMFSFEEGLKQSTRRSLFIETTK